MVTAFVPEKQLSAHLNSRADVGDALDAGEAELVWLRAAVIPSAGSTPFELIRHIRPVPDVPIST